MGNPDDGGLDLARALRGLRYGPTLEQLEELRGIDGVVGGVVDPAGAEDGVFGRPDEGMVGAVQRLTAVGERDLVDDRRGVGLARLVGDEKRLDPDLTAGVVEPPPGEQPQPWAAALGGIPALRRPSMPRRARAWSG